MHTSNIEVEHLKKTIREKINHTFIDKYIEKPVIDHHKLKILSNIIYHTNLSNVQKEKYIITTMLVQIALDTHDLVPIANHSNESSFNNTSRQLTVLAGDYFSGLYYLILSEIEDIHFIQILATAIKEINELKMKRYYKEVNSFKEFIKIEQKIESLLITRLTDFVNIPSMNKVNENLMITKKLIQEKINFHQEKETPFLEKWITSTTSNTYAVISQELNSIINNKFGIIKRELQYIPTSLKVNIQSIVYELENSNNKVVGED